MQRLGERISCEEDYAVNQMNANQTEGKHEVRVLFEEKQNRSTLAEKTMSAGMEKSKEFHEKREACIRKKYNADEMTQRIPSKNQ